MVVPDFYNNYIHRSVIFHVRRICKEPFNSFQLLDDCLQARTIDEVRAVVQQGIEYEKCGNYEYDPEKAKKVNRVISLPFPLLLIANIA